MQKTILELHHIHVHYGGVHALNDVSLSLHDGEIVALMGPNGAGKSTILKTIFGIAPKKEGEMYLHGKPLTPIPHRIVHHGIAFVPQGRRVFPQLSVTENLEIGGYILRDANEVRQRVRDMMDLFPILEEKKDTPSGTLSGGQQQLLAIARGLMTKPTILLLDEPSLGLAPKAVKEVFHHIATINRERKASIIIVEHNIASLLAIAHRGYILDKGNVVAEDSAKNLAANDTIKRVFTGTY